MTVMPLADSLRAIAEAGYRLIEISRKHRELTASARAIESHRLKVWAIHGTLQDGAAAVDEGLRRQAVELELLRMEDSAPYAPCPYVIHYLDRVNDVAVGEAFRKSVAELAERAEVLSLNLSVETAPRKEQTERYPDSEEIAGFARSFASEYVSVCVDVNHSNLAEDLARVAENCAGMISNIHVSDNWGKTEDHLPPGEGSIDLPAAMRALAVAGYGGPLNLECHLPGYPTVAELVKMRAWAEEILGAPVG